jgi:transposase InsO family protein/transposase-like protein
MKKRKSSDQKDKILLSYHSGVKVDVLAKRHKISRSIIYLWISETKRVKSLKKRHPLDFKNEIIQKIKNGSKVTEISELYHLSKSTVYNWFETIDSMSVKTAQIKVIEKEKYDSLYQLFKTYSITNQMSVEERMSLITLNSKTYSIDFMCRLFNVTRSTYYNYINHQTTPAIERDKLLKEKIMLIYKKHNKIASASKYKVILQEQQIIASEKKIRQLMHELGLQFNKGNKSKKYIRPKTSIKYRNLLKQDFNQSMPNRVWVSDITEIKINYRPIYLCVIIDLFSRKVIAYDISKVNNTRLSLTTYKKAVDYRKTHPMMFHSDRGVQYTSKIFRTHLKKFDVQLSYSAVGYPYDNAAMESFFSHFKRESVYPNYPFSTDQAYKSKVHEYMDYYNKKRLHSSIGMIPPNLKEGLYKKADTQKIVYQL